MKLVKKVQDNNINFFVVNFINNFTFTERIFRSYIYVDVGIHLNTATDFKNDSIAYIFSRYGREKQYLLYF